MTKARPEPGIPLSVAPQSLSLSQQLSRTVHYWLIWAARLNLGKPITFPEHYMESLRGVDSYGEPR